MRIENPLLALCRGTGYFSLARTFRTVWGESTRNYSPDSDFTRNGVHVCGAVPLSFGLRMGVHVRVAEGRDIVVDG